MQQFRWHRNRTVDVATSFLKAFKNNDSLFEINIRRGESQRFGDAAARHRNEPAEAVYDRIVLPRLLEETAGFGLGQIFSLTIEAEHCPGHDGFATFVFVGGLMDQKRPGALGLESD